MKHRFKVIEHPSGYQIEDARTGMRRWMSDGVDVLFTRTGKPRSPGTERFRRDWEHALNENEGETQNAYFDEEG